MFTLLAIQDKGVQGNIMQGYIMHTWKTIYALPTVQAVQAYGYRDTTGDVERQGLPG